MRAIVEIKTDPVRFVSDTQIAQPVMVASHERSGTHFLINSIAANSLYSNDPYLRYDVVPLGSFLNFYDETEVQQFFEHLARRSCASVIKNHFAASFFLERGKGFLLDGLCKVIYILRNPVEVLLSYHRFINHFSWNEGPKGGSALNFLATAPEGQMLRYQDGQIDTILERWKAHILGWLSLAEANSTQVMVVKYQDLDEHHAEVTRNILSFIGLDPPAVIARPDHMWKTVHVPNLRPAASEEIEKIRNYVCERIGSIEVIRDLFPEIWRQA